MTTEKVQERWSVVINTEEQYSIWPEDQTPPDGWHTIGVFGDKETCLDHIETVWTDMRPRSLREAMAAADNGQSTFMDSALESVPRLVDLLCSGPQKVTLVTRPADNRRALANQLGQGVAQLRFPVEGGPTEILISMDAEASDWTEDSLLDRTGDLTLSGSVKLDGERLIVVATIHAAGLDGSATVSRDPQSA